jgi:hypothetical protein
MIRRSAALVHLPEATAKRATGARSM